MKLYDIKLAIINLRRDGIETTIDKLLVAEHFDEAVRKSQHYWHQKQITEMSSTIVVGVVQRDEQVIS